MTKKQVIGWMASIETRSFSFQAIGATKEESQQILELGWIVHCQHTDADPGFLKEFRDDINFMPLYIGTCYRDNEIIYQDKK